MNITETKVTAAIDTANALCCHKMDKQQVKDAIGHGIQLLEQDKRGCEYISRKKGQEFQWGLMAFLLGEKP